MGQKNDAVRHSIKTGAYKLGCKTSHLLHCLHEFFLYEFLVHANSSVTQEHTEAQPLPIFTYARISRVTYPYTLKKRIRNIREIVVSVSQSCVPAYVDFL